MRMRSADICRSGFLLTGIVLLSCIAATPTSAQPGTHEATDPAVALSRQVWALQTLHDLDLDAAQLQLLKTAIPKPEDDPTPRSPSKVSAKYMAKLESLRQVLLRDEDADDAGDEIDELRDDLDSLREDESIRIDDHVRIADGARAKTADVMKLLKPSQLAGYLAAYQDEVPDPVQTLLTAAETARGMDTAKFNTLAEQTSRDIGILLAGLDKEKADSVANRIRPWLENNHAQSDADFKNGHAAQEASAKEVVGEFDPFDVLRHWVERDVAELLSNPQLPAMIDERIKHTRSQP